MEVNLQLKGAGQIRNGHGQLFFQKIFTPQFFSMWAQMGLIFIPQKDFWPFSHFWHFLAILKNLEKIEKGAADQRLGHAKALIKTEPV